VETASPRGLGNIAWSDEQVAAFERALAERPHFRRLNHVAINADDLQVSKKFYADVLGGRVIGESKHFVLVQIAETVIGLSDDRGKAPFGHAADAEFPHIAFEADSDQFLPMKKWLEEHGVKTHEPWTRFQEEALMYFKDPAGNLIEMYCPHYTHAREVRNTRDVRDVMDFEALNYTWDPTVAQPVLRHGAPDGTA
jgi:catechol 2,3-dioxygenase-like lactoylglutathione lyase family enzyme